MSIEADAAAARSSVSTYAFFALSKIAPGALLVIAVPLWVRAFGEAAYGVYAIVWGITLASTSVATGWIRQSTLRNAGVAGREVTSLPRWTVPLAATAGAVPPLVALAALDVSRTAASATGLVLATAAFAYASSLYGVKQAHNQRHLRVGRFAGAEITRAALALAVSLAVKVAVPAAGAEVIVGSYAVSTIAALVVLGRYASPSGHPDRSRAVLAEYWTYGWPMALWLGTSSAMLYLDRFIIALCLGEAEAGRYAAVADLIVRGIGMVAYPLTMHAHPQLMARWNRGDTTVLATLRRYLAVMAVLGLVAVAGVAVLGPTVLTALLDVSMPAAVTLPLAAGAALWQMALLSHKPLEMLGRTKELLVIIAVVTAATCTLDLLLLPRHGVVVAALAFATGSTAYVLTTWARGIVLLRRSERMHA